MSNRDSANDLSIHEKVAASSFLWAALFRQWPFVLLALVGCWGYFDLRGQIEELQTQFAATPSPQSGGVEVQDAKSSIQEQPPSRPETNWNCTGAITREEVRDVIGREGRAAFRCYGEQLAENPDLRGSIDIRLHVNAAGVVNDMRLEGGDLAMDAGFTECLWKSVSEWRFPAPGGGDCAVVSAPFILGPRNTEETSTNESNGIPDSADP
jgi:hypothetical protein